MPGILGRTAIVTGAAGGIGQALVRAFLANGASVVMSDVDEVRLKELEAELAEHGVSSVAALAGDLSSPGTAEALVRTALDTFGRLDILVANAGGGVVARTLDHTEDTLQATIDRNLWTAIRSALAVIPHFQEQGYGRVVFMGADSVRNGLDGHAIYNAAKGGVHAMARGLAREFAQAGITFNVVSPCATRTPELDRFMRDDPSLADRFLAVIPAGRPAELREVASAVMYLASEEAAFVTGQVLPVNGGSTMV
jgi:2,3-dihydroxy-2,3-dihydro-p-cumate dehydrogenase